MGSGAQRVTLEMIVHSLAELFTQLFSHKQAGEESRPDLIPIQPGWTCGDEARCN